MQRGRKGCEAIEISFYHVTSVGPQESVRFGEESDLETEDVLDRAAHSSVDLDKTHGEDDMCH